MANLLGRNKKGFLTDSFLLEELKTVTKTTIYPQFLSLPKERLFLIPSTEGCNEKNKIIIVCTDSVGRKNVLTTTDYFSFVAY